MTENPLAAEATAAGVEVLQPVRASAPDFLAAFAAWEPDLAVVVSYGQILSQDFLAIPRLGCVNLHASLLPRCRGASPVQAVLLAGDPRTGVSLQRMVPELDAGPVLAAREMAVPPRAAAPELGRALAGLGGELLGTFLDELGEGPLPRGVEQDPKDVTVCRRLRREEGRIDWARSAREIDRRVRALAGWPWAYTHSGDLELRLLPSERDPVVQGDGGGTAAGTILETGKELLVSCGSGVYRIEELQRAGRRPMPVEEFLRGRPLAVGDRFV